MSEWDKYYAPLVDTQKERFNVSTKTAANQDPQRVAAVDALASAAGVDYDYADRNFDELQKKQNEQNHTYDYDALRTKYPTLTDFLSSRENAALAKDDIGTLTRLNDVFVRSPAAGSLQAAGGAYSGLAAGSGSFSRQMERTGMGRLGPNYQFLQTVTDLFSRTREGGEAVQDFARDKVATPQERRGFSDDVAEGIGQIGTQILSYVLTGPIGGTVALTGQGMDIQADKAEEAGVELISGDADTAIALGGIVTAGTERVQLGRIVRAIKPLERAMGVLPKQVQRKWLNRTLDIAGAGAGEAVQESVEGILQDVVEYVTYNPDPKVFDDMVPQLADEASVAGVSGAIARAILLGVTGGRRMRDIEGEAQEANENLNTVMEAKDLSGISELRQRSPKKFRELLKAMNSENREVRLDAEVVEELYQSEIDRDALFSMVEGMKEQFEAAELSGSDIVVPAHDFVNAISGEDSEAYSFMLGHLKNSERTMSANQAQRLENPDVMNEQVQAILDEARKEYDAQLDEQIDQGESQEVYEAIRRNLYDRGKMGDKAYTPEEAGKVAALHKAFFDTMSQGNEAARNILRRMYGKLEFKGPERKPFVRADQMDLVIDRLRNIQTGQVSPIKAKKPVISAIRKRGRVRRGSPLAAELQQAGVTPKEFPNLFHSKGDLMGFDDIVASELADEIGVDPSLIPQAENGYVDPDGLVQLMRDETFGADITSEMFTDPMDEAADMLAEELSYLGVDLDLSEADNETIKAAMEAARSEFIEEPLNDVKEFYQSPIEKAQRNGIGLYSALEREVLSMSLPQWKKGGAASGKSIWQKIKSLPIKNEELEWLGIEEYLLAGDKFTRDETAEFIRNNGVTVEEVVATEESALEDGELEFSSPEIWDDPEAWQHRVEDLMYEFDEGDNPYDIRDIAYGKVVEDDESYIRNALDEDVLAEIDESGEDFHRADAVREYIDADMYDAFRAAAEEYAEEAAKEEYMDDPVQIWEANDLNDGDLYIFGNESTGFSVREGSWELAANSVRDDIWSFSEAVIQASDYAREYGLISDETDVNVKKWEEYVEGDFDNYREIKLTLPDIDADYHNDVHFPDRNLVAFLRVTDRQIENKKKVQEGLDSLPDNPPDNAPNHGGYGRDLGSLKKRMEKTKGELEDINKDLRPLLDEFLKSYPDASRLSVDELMDNENISDLIVLARPFDDAGSDLISHIRAKHHLVSTVMPSIQSEIDRIHSDWAEDQEYLKRYLSDNREIERSPDYESPVTYETVKVNKTDGSVKYRIDAKDDTGAIRVSSPEYDTAEDAQVAIPADAENKTVKVKGKVTKVYAPYEKTFFIDEMQSDWHQEGRQKGYRTGEFDAGELEENAFDLIDELKDDYQIIGDGEWQPLYYAAHSGDYKNLTKDSNIEIAKNPDFVQRAKNIKRMRDMVSAERYGADNAPFKGDNWLQLGLKRALVQAVENDYTVFAWADAEVLANRWSSSYADLYNMQYDTKMPSIIKKLTKKKPMHVKSEDADDGVGYWAIILDDKLKERIREESFSLFQSSQDGKRGSIQFGNSKTIVNVFEGGDMSTVLHESGHFFLEAMREIAAQPDTPVEVMDDWNKLLGWIGVKSADEIGVEQHEKFAEGFEKYLFEGRAPSKELIPVFDRFLTWLINAYKNIRGIGTVRLNDDIRGVFDRMLATSEQIEKVRSSGFNPDPATLEMLNEEEKRRYIEAGERQLAEAKQKTFKKAMTQLKRQRTKWWKEEMEAQTEQAEEMLKTQPIYKAYNFFRTGEDFAGNNLGFDENKLSRKDIERLYGPEAADRMPRGTTKRSGGMRLSQAISMFGFKSADDMMDQLMNFRPMNDVAIEQAEELMIERHGDMLRDGTIEREAIEAAMSEEPVAQMMELKSLENRNGVLYPDAANFKAAANEFIGSLDVDAAIKPNRYYTASLKAAREYGRWMAKKDYDKAAEAKRKEVFSKYAFKAARDAREDVQKTLKRFQKLNKKPAKGKVKIDPEYHEQIWTLLDRYNLGPQLSEGKRTKLEMQALAQWIEAKRQNDDAPLILPTRLIEADSKTHYRQLTVDEFNDLKDMVLNLEALGRNKLKWQNAKDQRDLNEIASEAAQRIYEYNDIQNDPLSPRRERQKLSNIPKGFANALDVITSKAQAIIEQLDGGEMGPVFRYLRQNIREAEVENSHRQREAAEEYKAILTDIYGKDGLKGTFGMAENLTTEDSKIFIESLGRSMTREQIIAVALHYGTDDNAIKMREGRGWSDENVSEILSHMRNKDWDYVERAWDMMGKFWPEIAALEKRRVGFAPEKVEGRRFTVTTAEGNERQISGQYAPLMYDSDLDLATQEMDIDQVYEELRAGRRTRAQTLRGHTEERVAGVKKPVRLDLDVVNEHISRVITDLTLSEAIDSSHKFLHHPEVREAISQTLGVERHRQLDVWLKDTAVSGMMAGGDMNRILRKLRHNYTVGRLGFKAATVFIQFTGVAQSAADIGAKNISNGVLKLFSRGNPYQMVADVKEKSPYMAEREFTFTRDVNDVFDKISKQSGEVSKKWQAGLMMPMQKAQQLVDVATWIGAYEKAIKEGRPENDAITYADSVVEKTQGSGLPSSLAAIERGTFNDSTRGQELVKAMTMFYSYFNAKYNLARTKYTQFRQGEISGVQLASSYFWLFLVEAALGDFVLGRLDLDDDDDGEITALEMMTGFGWASIKTAGSSIPLGRDIISGIEGFSGGNAATRQMNILGRSINTLGDIGAGAFGEDDINLYRTTRGMVDAANVFVPIPASQINQVLRGMEKAEDEGDAGVMDYFVYSED